MNRGPGAWRRALPLVSVLACTLAAGAAHAGSWAPSLAEALRDPGPVLVLDCGEARLHRELADKVADELRPLRGNERPARAWADDLDRLMWEHAHVVLLCDEPGHAAVLALAPGLDLERGQATLRLAGMTARGEDAGAAAVLPHPRDAERWVILLTGTSPAAIRRLDRHIRNDIVASALLVDDHGERLAALVRDGQRWSAPAGHPYRAEDVRAALEERERVKAPRLVAQELAVSLESGTQRLDVRASVEVAQAHPDGRAWLQLTSRATQIHCGGADPCVPFDGRDGRLLVDAPVSTDGIVELSYSVLLEGRNGAWYVGASSGYLLPSANAFPRVRGAADEPFADPAPWSLRFTGPDGVSAVGADEHGVVRSDALSTPNLVWGRHRRVQLGGGRTAYLAEGAPDEQAARAAVLLDGLAGRLGADAPAAMILVATERQAPWYGDGVMLAPPDLMEPRPVDELDGWLLDRLATEQRVRMEDPRGPPRRVRGVVQSASEPVTVRLWRLRGPWWQQVDEGPVDAAGAFSLVSRGPGSYLLTAEAPGQQPAVHELARDDGPILLELRPLTDVALLCLRCGADLEPRRFPMAEVEPGIWRTTVALGPPMREYGSFPYGFELGPGAAGAARVLDAGGAPEQFPSFLAPEAFHADAVEFEFRTGTMRFWIEVPGGLLAPVGWISPAP